MASARKHWFSFIISRMPKYLSWIPCKLDPLTNLEYKQKRPNSEFSRFVSLILEILELYLLLMISLADICQVVMYMFFYRTSSRGHILTLLQSGDSESESPKCYWTLLHFTYSEHTCLSVCETL